MPTNVIMPQLGESVVEGTVSRWLKQVGDPIAEYEPLVEISTDKVNTEIPAPATGVVLKIYVDEGTTVERGVLLAVIGQEGEQTPEAGNGVGDHAAAVPKEEATVTVESEQERTEAPIQRYSPVVTRMAAEHKLDLSKIKGTGISGRVTKKDVEAYLAQPQATEESTEEIPAWEQPISGDLFKPTEEVFAKANAITAATPAPTVATRPVPSVARPSGDGELIPHSAMRKVIAEHMVRSKLQTAPHVTTLFEIDMQKTWNHWQANMEAYEKQGARLTLTAYFLMAMVKAVQAQRVLNSQWTEQGLFVPHTINIGMAVALTDGLIVPVIKNAQDLNLMGMARQVTDLATRARAKQLKPDDTAGGTITLTNHGVSGSLLATPIINQPQSAIIGTGVVQKRVVVLPDTDAIAIRPMMYATLTFDHRVADGAIGDAFMVTFKQTLENWT
jgi:2-oxoglutarate dehydrogenase E2 component (dihydrolipoamide succinyltransferase)